MGSAAMNSSIPCLRALSASPAGKNKKQSEIGLPMATLYNDDLTSLRVGDGRVLSCGDGRRGFVRLARRTVERHDPVVRVLLVLGRKQDRVSLSDGVEKVFASLEICSGFDERRRRRRRREMKKNVLVRAMSEGDILS
jgi:hypothetical protein